LAVVGEEGLQLVGAPVPDTVKEAVSLVQAASDATVDQLECAVGAGLGQGAALQAVETQPALAAKKPKIRFRADVKWSWKRYYWMHLTYSLWCNLSRKNAPSRAVCMVVHKNGRPIPIGMLTLVPDFTCTILDRTKPRAYTWYLSDAPREFYSHVLQLEKIQFIARALVDYTVQSGIEANQEATLVLRADAGGGKRLKEFYEELGLAPLPDDHPAISPGRVLANGGYFKLMPEQTTEFSSYMDVYRSSNPRQLLPVEYA
jgi:hypothetical protein